MDTKRNTALRAKRILEIATRMAKGIDGYSVENRIDEIQLHFHGYAEPGYSESESGIIATGNWNDGTRYDGNERVVTSTLPSRISALFASMGIECEWSDEWSECYSCSKLVRTSPDSYSYKPSYAIVGECDLLCHECIAEDPSEYLEEREGDSHHCVTIESIDLAAHGYKRVDETYESGWHPGQTDKPSKVAEDLRAVGITRFLFRLDEQSQFFSRWSVWVHDEKNGDEEEQAST